LFTFIQTKRERSRERELEKERKREELRGTKEEVLKEAWGVKP
jgi:hypothetical protein